VLAMTLPICGNRCEFINSSVSFVQVFGFIATGVKKVTNVNNLQ